MRHNGNHPFNQSRRKHLQTLASSATKTLAGSIAVLLFFSLAESSFAQVGQEPRDRTVPREGYFLGFAPFYDGDYADAAKVFKQAHNVGIRSTSGRWVDSICTHTMMGDCYYHMGELPLAMEQYESALKIYLAYSDWMLRADFPPTVLKSSQRRTFNWGAPERQSFLGNVPDKVLSRQGRLDNDRVLQQGGVIAQAELLPIRAHEIVRCTVLALRRRMELLGPTCSYDPLTAQLIEALSRRPAPPSHWTQSWVSVQLGLAYASAGKDPQAVEELNKSLLLSGSYDHHLTATALLELGKLALKQGQNAAAAKYFYEATFPAEAFGDQDVMEEAFRWATITHIITGGPGMYPPLANASAWARTQGGRALRASLFLNAAENACARGDGRTGASLTEEAMKTLSRQDMSGGNMGARAQFVASLVNYKAGKIPQGDAALASSLKYQQKASHWLLQIAIADKLYTSGAVTPRLAATLFSEVLRDPTPDDWSLQPLESLSVVATPHLLPLEHWFEVLLSRKDHEEALEVADRVKRHRFYSTLPMGGRLLSLRWLLEGPPEALSQLGLLQKQTILGQFPDFAQLSRKAQTAREELRRLPLAPDLENARKQEALLKELATLSTAQEALLREIAVRRVPAEFVFPPIRSVKELQQKLEPGQIVLSYFATSRYVHGFALSKEKYANWRVAEPRQLSGQLVGLLKEFGNHDGNLVIGQDQLENDAWRGLGLKILQLLTNNENPNFWKEFDELIIVPDGVLWYLPFEALPTGDSGDALPLVSRIRIRYAPTTSLILPDDRNLRPLLRSAVVAGELFPREGRERSQQTTETLKELLPGVEALPDNLPGPSSLVAATSDRIIVLDDLDSGTKGPYDWSPLPQDKGKAGSFLGDWLALPFGGPEQVLLPGYHTPAENSLKRGGTGDEMFLTVCGLMGSGVRTILISRWRTGGDSAQSLVREFAQELPYTEASSAWQRSVQLALDSPLDPEQEPRFKPAASDGSLKAKHPFFWSGYMLIDTGSAPPRQ